MRPAAYLGLFTDIGIDAPDCSLRFTAKLPVADLRHLFSVIGFPTPAPPPETDALYPGVLIAPCRRPVHPETEEQVLAAAAVAVLQHLVGRDPAVLSPALQRELRHLSPIRDWTQPRGSEGLWPRGETP